MMTYQAVIALRDDVTVKHDGGAPHTHSILCTVSRQLQFWRYICLQKPCQ